jgi:crotonobetainyl-CoA:carnitine CoA-transferase CaiB-like acyl-CoA transferase
MLSPYRVIDLTDERGLLAGKMLADLGADVIQVEPPGGSTARRVPPFADGQSGSAARSLYWEAYAANKRGVSCDLSRPEGQTLLRRLAATADFLFESSAPGELAAHGLGYDKLAAINPRLVYTSITPFGQSGPKAAYADSDLVLWAAGGPLGAAREPDRPPLRVSVPQSYLHAAADAAGGALIAHFERLRSGRGQHVDVSVQQSVAQATLSTILSAAVGHTQTSPRAAPGVARWQVKDGYVEFVLGMGSAGARSTTNFMRWLHEQGGCDAETAALDWRQVGEQVVRGEFPDEEYQRIRGLVAEFLRGCTKQELLEAAVRCRFMLTPVLSAADLHESPHLAARNFWQRSDAASKGAMRFPVVVVPPEAAGDRPLRAAPTLSQHNRAIYLYELGLSEAELRRLESEGIV